MPCHAMPCYAPHSPSRKVVPNTLCRPSAKHTVCTVQPSASSHLTTHIPGSWPSPVPSDVTYPRILRYLANTPLLSVSLPFLSSRSLQPQLLIKRLRIRLSSQKLDQRLHLILTATLLQNRMSIPSSLLSVHGIRLEYTVEHVGAVDLGGEVAVVAGLNRKVSMRSFSE